MQKKLKMLEQVLKNLPPFAVAFSGGVDSSFLLAVAKKINPENVHAITVSSQFVPEREIEAAKRIALLMGIELICLDVDILKNNEVVRNSVERCYHCKKQMFSLIKKTAENSGVSVFLHAVNLDDLNEFRPGLKAAEELGFLSPLVDAKFSKAEIRQTSRQLGLETWNKPSQSCLATRMPNNEAILADRLRMVDWAEMFLQDLGFPQVRVRYHGKAARIEVDPGLVEMLSSSEILPKVSLALSKIGFEQISVDREGYKTGKMNHEIFAG